MLRVKIKFLTLSLNNIATHSSLSLSFGTAIQKRKLSFGDPILFVNMLIHDFDSLISNLKIQVIQNIFCNKEFKRSYIACCVSHRSMNIIFKRFDFIIKKKFTAQLVVHLSFIHVICNYSITINEKCV
jgi:hypothetical protein